MRVGLGCDVHRLAEGRKLILGGVELEHPTGLLGHSDADALCHAVIDALFGAAALGDIGAHFPDTDPKYAGADSLALLREAGRLVRAEGYEIENIDSIVIAQRPKMAPYTAKMAANIAEALGVAPERVSVKAKTNEGLGYLGLGEAIETRAACLIEESARGKEQRLN